MKLQKYVVIGAAVITALVVARDVEAQVAGNYVVEYPTQIRRGGDGSESMSSMASVKVSLEVKGDSVFGTWHVTSTPNPQQPVKLWGKLQQGGASFRLENSVARVNINGDVKEIEMVTDVTLTIEGDTVKGTMNTASADGTISAPARPLTGKRAA